jgi:hypothetical protein
MAIVAVAAFVVSARRPDPGPPSGTDPVWVGVHDGDSIPDYVAQAGTRLAALDPGVSSYALVSLSVYLAPADVAVVFAGVTTVTAFARVPLVGRQTERVSLPAVRLPADLVAAMTAVADRKVTDAAADDALATAQPAGTLRDVYSSNAAVARTEANAYRTACACVFAMVVRAGTAALSTLARNVKVRAVDPVPGLTDPGLAVFAPPLPDQTDQATPPVDDLPTS